MNWLKFIFLLAFTGSVAQSYTTSISDVTVTEGEVAHFTLTISEPQLQPTSIQLLLAARISFDPVADFDLLTDTVIIPAGETTAPFDIITTEDTHGEATEYGEVCAYVQNPGGENPCGRLTILDDDPNIIGPIVAQNDALTLPANVVNPGYNVLNNDTINGIPVTVDSVILTPVSLPEGFLLIDYGQMNFPGNQAPGVYTITYQLCAVSDPDNCTTATVSLTFYDPLNSIGFAFENFEAHPNPVQNELFIRNDSLMEKIEITSLAGQMLRNEKINALQSTVDLSNLPHGLYLGRIQSQAEEKVFKICKE